MPCIFCEAGICIDPSHGVVRTYEPPTDMTRGRLQLPSSESSEPQTVRIFDIQGPSFLPSSSSTSFIPSTNPTSVIIHGLPLRDYLRLRTAPLENRVDVRKYWDEEGGWDEGSQIVKDAEKLRVAWVNEAKRVRGSQNWESSEPEENMCSGEDWLPCDEGMDVAGEIADVESQAGRDEEGITLWRAYVFPSKAVGILITQHAVSDEDHAELGIRWLIGHPTIKGAGAVLMAKADELHRTVKYKNSPMHVTASASSVKWYKSKGFKDMGPAKCHDDVTPCGCRIMQKPAPT